MECWDWGLRLSIVIDDLNRRLRLRIGIGDWELGLGDCDWGLGSKLGIGIRD